MPNFTREQVLSYIYRTPTAFARFNNGEIPTTEQVSTEMTRLNALSDDDSEVQTLMDMVEPSHRINKQLSAMESKFADLSLTGSQAVPNLSSTVVNWGRATGNELSDMELSANTGVFVYSGTKTAIFAVSYQLRFEQTSAGGYREGKVVVPSGDLARQITTSNSQIATTVSSSTFFQLTRNDQFTVVATHNGGTNINLVSTGGGTKISIVRL